MRRSAFYLFADAPRHRIYQKLVTGARRHGLRAAARHFGGSRNTLHQGLCRQTGLGPERPLP